MVAVLDAWTSPRGRRAERRNVFGVGETLQFNGVFVTERDTPSRVRIVFLIESLSNFVSTVNRAKFEIAFKPQRVLEGDFTVGPGATRAFASFVIPDKDPDDFDWRGRQETAFELASGGFDFIFVPSLYSFRVLVQLRDAATGHSFDLSNMWTYTITS